MDTNFPSVKDARALQIKTWHHPNPPYWMGLEDPAIILIPVKGDASGAVKAFVNGVNGHRRSGHHKNRKN